MTDGSPTPTDVRQCLIYDTPQPNARLIGVEYMISATLYKSLEPSERKLWHSHVFEVKSGMLIMPGPNGLPTRIWEEAETKEMEDVVGLYGKTYHFWQVDRGDKLPLGGPELMMSFTKDEDCPGFNADQVWKGSAPDREKNQERAGATNEEASLLKGTQANLKRANEPTANNSQMFILPSDSSNQRVS
ncbi:hypothetical protein MMC28_004280 [Mycoblastus sanguinarius]|nr:hypothetical protein [Mycoblastus sanguinarius]